jgi:hypothetical protein
MLACTHSFLWIGFLESPALDRRSLANGRSHQLLPLGGCYQSKRIPATFKTGFAQNARSLECARHLGTSGGVLEIARIIGGRRFLTV